MKYEDFFYYDKNLKFEISYEYLLKLFEKQEKKCALSGIPIILQESLDSDNGTAYLDLIDPSLGYVEKNVRLIHKNLISMKGNLSDKYFLELCQKCILKQYEVGKVERPTFDEYFLNIAFDVSLRSDDPNIRHGALIVSYNNHILGTGYNGTIRGSNKDVVPYHIRDKKRLWMIHAEENAILNCTTNPISIGGAKMYVTGLPCVNCLQRIINFGIKEIFYADRIGSITENEETQKMREQLISMSKISMNKINLDNFWLKRIII